MRIRPWPIVLVAVICMIAPIFNFIYSALILNKSLVDYYHMIFRLTHPAELAIWFLLPPLVGLAIFAFNKWSYFLFLGFMSVISIWTAYEWSIHTTKFSTTSFLLFELVNCLVIAYFLLPGIRFIYFTPQVRWWEQKPRYLVSIPAKVRVGHQEHKCEIRNISEGGALVYCTTPLEATLDFDLNFNLQGTAFNMQGNIVHAGKDGYGCVFADFTPSVKDYKKAIYQLKKSGVPQRTPPPPWQKSLWNWIKTFLKTGKGLVPESQDDKKK